MFLQLCSHSVYARPPCFHVGHGSSGGSDTRISTIRPNLAGPNVVQFQLWCWQSWVFYNDPISEDLKNDIYAVLIVAMDKCVYNRFSNRLPRVFSNEHSPR